MTKRMIIACTLFLSVWGGPAESQPASAGNAANKNKHPAAAPAGKTPADLAKQIEQLKTQLSRLEAAVGHGPGGGVNRPMRGMGRMPMGRGMASKGGMGMMDDNMMGGMMGMGGMADGMGMTGAMPAGGMGMGGMTGCCPMMGQMSAGGAMSTLPGFPGASHLYHIGETGFFLDHPEHITLSGEQAAKLGTIREEAMRARGEFQRKIAAAEEQLWQLTAADEPSQSSIEAKTREIEKLRADQRLAFIRAVGEAAAVLTDEQRKALLGQLPPSPNPATGMGQATSPGGTTGGTMMDDPMQMPPSGGGSMGDM